GRRGARPQGPRAVDQVRARVGQERIRWTPSRQEPSARRRRHDRAAYVTQRGDPHDWASETYVEEWVRRQQVEDPIRAERFQLLCDLFPFPQDAPVPILDVGAGYVPVSTFIRDRYPRATCIAQDGSEPMLNRARTLVASYSNRFKPYHSDLFETGWLPEQFGPFDAVVSSSCLHNLRNFERISEIYREIREHLRAGGVFLNLDLVNAPTAELHQRYDVVLARRRRRDVAPADDIGAMVPSEVLSTVTATIGPFPSTTRRSSAACKMRLKKGLLAFRQRLHARIRKAWYMHKMRFVLINSRSLLLALRL